MNITINLFDKGLVATYSVEQEDTITYNIRLKSFDGTLPPPSYIKLYKTEMGWRSAFEDAELISNAGRAIDKKKE